GGADRTGPDREGPAARHRLSGVPEEMGERLAKGRGIQAHPEPVRRRDAGRVDHHARIRGRGERLEGRAERGTEIGGLHAVDGGSAETRAVVEDLPDPSELEVNHPKVLADGLFGKRGPPGE